MPRAFDPLAVYAAVLSTALGGVRIWELLHRDRTRLKVEGKADMLRFGYGVYGDQEEPCVVVTVRNVGRRPATIETVGLEQRGQGGDILMPELLNGLPSEIKEGQAWTGHALQAELDKAGVTDQVKGVVVVDQTGKAWRGPFRRTERHAG